VALTLSEAAPLPDDLRALGVRCIDSLTPAVERGLVMQGVPLGSPEFVTAWLDERLASQREVMRRLATYVPDRLVAAQMLSWCIVPRIAHLLRALPPLVTADFARAFDDACVQCFTAIAAPDFAQAGLPPAADDVMRLKLRDGGFDIGGQHRSAPAAYVAAWASARQLICRLAPSLAPLLPRELHVRPAGLGPAISDPAAIAISQDDSLGPALPAPILALHDAIAMLGDQGRSTLEAYAAAEQAWEEFLAAPPDAAAPPPAGAAAAPAGSYPAVPRNPAKIALQSQLSRPSHDSFHATFVSSRAADSVLMARHHSQTGYLGMVWFQRLNQPGAHHISSAAFCTAVALHLGLPIAAFEGLTCGCGTCLTAASGPLHIVSCNQFAKLARSETFQHAFDSIIYDVCPDARIEGAKPARGQQRQCGTYASVPVVRGGAPVLDTATGLPALRAVIPDRVARPEHARRPDRAQRQLRHRHRHPQPRGCPPPRRRRHHAARRSRPHLRPQVPAVQPRAQAARRVAAGGLRVVGRPAHGSD